MEFLIPISVIIINIVISLLLWNASRTRLNRALVYVWTTSGFHFVILVLTGHLPFYTRTVLLFPFVLTSYSFLAHLLATAVDMKIPWKPLLLTAATCFGMGILVHLAGAAPVWSGMWMALGPAIVLSFASLRVLVSKSGCVSTIARAMALTLVIFAIHGLDYPITVHYPQVFEIGRVIGLALIFLLSSLTPALAVEKEAANRERVEAELRYRSAIAHSARMTAIGEMAGGIAHQINSPLSVIQLNAEIVRKLAASPSRPATTTNLERSADTILTTVDRIARIVRGLRQLSQEDEREPFQEVSVAELLTDTAEFSTDRLHEHGIQLSLAVPAAGLRAQCRPMQVSQILLSLINNAEQALQNRPGEKRIRLIGGEQNGKVVIAVCDNGPGIAPELRERIFEPFFTSRPTAAGTGLGLSISRGLAENNKGRLFLDTESDWTRFVLEVPKASDSEAV